MRDVCLVSSYAPDRQRQDMLRGLVRFLKGKKDVILVSHSHVPQDILEDVRYSFYDEENEIIKKNSVWFWHELNGSRVWTRDPYWERGSTLLPVTKLFFNGLTLAKTLGYEVAHYVEYDTVMESVDFLDENALDISGNNLDGVVYWNQNDHPVGAVQSYRLASYDYKRLQWDRDFLMSRWRTLSEQQDTYPAPVETIVYEIMNYRLGLKAIPEDKLNITSMSPGLPIPKDQRVKCVVVVNPDGTISLFAKNEWSEEVKVTSILDDGRTKTYTLFPTQWIVTDLDSVHEVKNIKILVDYEMVKEFDLSTPEKIKSHMKINYFT